VTTGKSWNGSNVVAFLVLLHNYVEIALHRFPRFDSSRLAEKA
jgi:hypothetical protein